MNMKIYLGADHGGISLKQAIIAYLKEQNTPYEDLGAYSTESVDYPEFGKKVAERVASEVGSLGIVICNTGVGMSIAANKIKGIRAAVCTTSTHDRLAKDHNNANVLALGAMMTGETLAIDIVKAFIETPFSNGERHIRRLTKLAALEG